MFAHSKNEKQTENIRTYISLGHHLKSSDVLSYLLNTHLLSSRSHIHVEGETFSQPQHGFGKVMENSLIDPRGKKTKKKSMNGRSVGGQVILLAPCGNIHPKKWKAVSA